MMGSLIAEYENRDRNITISCQTKPLGSNDISIMGALNELLVYGLVLIVSSQLTCLVGQWVLPKSLNRFLVRSFSKSSVSCHSFLLVAP